MARSRQNKNIGHTMAGSREYKNIGHTMAGSRQYKFVCFCYTLYVRNSKSLKLEKFEVGKDRSSKRSTLQKFEVRNVLFLLALIWLIKFRLYNNII